MPNNIAEHKLETFDQVTRALRWLSIALVLLTFPFQASKLSGVLIFLGVVAVYNLARYIALLRRAKLFTAPLTIILVDCLFVSALIGLVGNINTPYTALLLFMIVSSAYLYQMRGVVTVVFAEAFMLAGVTVLHPFQPSVISPVREIIIVLFIVASLGYLVAKLTDADQVERKELDTQRHTSDQERLRLLTLMDSLEYAIFIADSHGRLLLANETAKTYIEVPDNAMGQDLHDVLHLCKSDDPKAKRVNILKAGISVQRRRDLSLVDKAGNKVALDLYVTKILKNKKEVAEYIIVCNDISHERTLEEQQSSFIAVASHELRTPLTIVEGALATALAMDKSMAPATKEVIEQAHRNTLQLANILKDLAIMAEAQNNNVPIQLGWVNPTQLVDECAADFESQVKQRGLELKKVVADDLPLLMSTEHYIREILQNFLTNALKYSQKGLITITAEPWEYGGVRFSVSDQGIGISKSDQTKIFTKFFRAEDYRTRQTGGVGLGLYLCMELANRIDAKIWFASKLNEGSTFYLDVPKQSNAGRDQGEIVKTQVSNLVDSI